MAELTALMDAELLILLKEDNQSAFEEIYNRHWLSLFNIAYKRLKDKEISKDITHDVFASLWDKRHIYHIDDLLPYLHTAVRNKIYTLLSKGLAPAHFVEPFENMGVSPLTADRFFEESELRRIVALWIDTLPAKRREIFRLRFLEELSTKEISERLNISQKTVQNQLLNGVDGLRANMSRLFALILLLELTGK